MNSYYSNPKFYCPYMYQNKAIPTAALAKLTGAGIAPNLSGTVYFKDVPGGTEVSVEVNGLPAYKPGENGKQPIGPHGFHIHKFGNCEVGDPNKPFTSTDGHWNPTNQPHG